MMTKLRIKKEAEKIIKPYQQRFCSLEKRTINLQIEALMKKVREETISECVLVGNELLIKNKKDTNLFWNKFKKEIKC
jgi:hypothetical protein